MTGRQGPLNPLRHVVQKPWSARAKGKGLGHLWNSGHDEWRFWWFYLPVAISLKSF